MDNSTQIAEAIEVLLSGGVIIYPTETVLGLGSVIDNKNAIDKLNEIKNRPSEKSFIILVSSIEMVERYCPNINSLEKSLLEQKEPTTVILSNIVKTPESLLFKDGSLAFRITQHPEIKELISKMNQPILSTSANISGEPTIKSWKNVNPVILDQVDYALNLQSDFISTQQPSQIVKVENDEIIYIRR